MIKGNTVRIIGGKWRGRKLTLPRVNVVRPTPDRVRETVFNWLAPYIVDSHVLDLFAGSGALGFEALSRGAESALLLDQHPQVIAQLNATKTQLAADDAQIVLYQFPQPLPLLTPPFDIVFLDPPFHQDYIAQAILWLHNQHCLAKKALIYIEAEVELTLSPLPWWHVLKQKTAGQVAYYLLGVSQ